MNPKALQHFSNQPEKVIISPIGPGLINLTWKVDVDDDSFILQEINHRVFKNPEDIAHNIEIIGKFLQDKSPDYLFPCAIEGKDGSTIFKTEEACYYRVFPFVKNSQTIVVVNNPNEAWQAAKQFGKFTALLNDFDADQLKITLPNFHNLSLRYEQLMDAVVTGSTERKNESEELIRFLTGQQFIVDKFESIKINPEFKLRPTHHDTKISNVLFDPESKGLCVIDLDTVMPGYFFSDVGDMMRTYLCPVSEEEKDFSKIEVRDDYYKAVVDGYYSQMAPYLTDEEKQSFFYSGTFMIYMQAMRFLTDYLNNDIYYGAKYPGHNFIRAKNQVILLQKLLDKKEILENYIPV